MEKKILDNESKASIQENFKILKEPVTLMLFTKKGQNDQYNDIATELIQELADLDSKLKVELNSLESDAAKKYQVDRSPTLLISPEKYHIRFTGAPLGEEGRTLIMAILMASTGMAAMSDDSTKRLEKLTEKRNVRVFVSPS